MVQVFFVSIAVSDMGNSTPFTVFFDSDLASGESTPVVVEEQRLLTTRYDLHLPGSLTASWKAGHFHHAATYS
jgi:hypothetical protein